MKTNQPTKPGPTTCAAQLVYRNVHGKFSDSFFYLGTHMQFVLHEGEYRQDGLRAKLCELYWLLLRS